MTQVDVSTFNFCYYLSGVSDKNNKKDSTPVLTPEHISEPQETASFEVDRYGSESVANVESSGTKKSAQHYSLRGQHTRKAFSGICTKPHTPKTLTNKPYAGHISAPQAEAASSEVDRYGYTTGLTATFLPLATAALFPNLSVLQPTPYTLHPTPYTLHPEPYTLHPSPYTLTRHPEH